MTDEKQASSEAVLSSDGLAGVWRPGTMGRAGAPSHHRVVHAAPYDTTDYFGKALCGKAPSTRWHGWQWPHPLHPASYWQIECPRCIKAVANLKPAN